MYLSIQTSTTMFYTNKHCKKLKLFPIIAFNFIIYYIKLCFQIRIDVLLKFDTIKVEQLARSGKYIYHVYHGEYFISRRKLYIKAKLVYHGESCISRRKLYITAKVVHGKSCISRRKWYITAKLVYHGKTCISRQNLCITAKLVYHGQYFILFSYKLSFHCSFWLNKPYNPVP